MTMHRGSAVYPGSFDPVTNGHIDIVRRSLTIFDSVTVAVLENSSKSTLFTPAERVAMFEAATEGISGVSVVTFSGLLVDLLEQVGSTTILRGLRFLSDYEYELQMALMNQSLRPGVETIFMVANPERTFVSSSLVKEVARLGRDVSPFVPPNVVAALKGKFS
jgi:pantetheine-phosphate adenylyltransferase